jgi:cation diffusion facilitator family transporter
VPDESHPHGYGKEAFFWSFLAAIFIFVAGAAFSFFEWIRTAIQNDEHERAASELILAFSVLGMAIVFESISFAVAMRSLLRGAAKGWGILRYIREAPDVTTKTVFEDSAAITGLGLAASGLALSEITANEMWDAVASISIGVVLAAVSVMLGVQSRKLLLGAAASEETRIDLHRVLMTFPEVQGVMRMLTMQLGSNSVLVTGELRVQRNLTTEQIEDLLRRIDGKIAIDVPEVAETFWELSRQANGGLLRPSAGSREAVSRPG